MNITQITIEEVRCFAAPQQFNIRPLTFLVGENSTGKTTTLACFQVLADFLSKGEADFNLDPYSMGVFEDIVRRIKRPDKTFNIGFSFADAGGKYDLTAVFAEREGGVDPFLSSATLRFDDGEIVFEFRDSSRGSRKPVQYYGQGSKYRICLDSFDAIYFRIFLLLTTLTARGTEGQTEVKSALVNYVERKSKQHRGLSILGSVTKEPTVLSSSPVRSRPKRTYDPIRESMDPEGGDAPMTLMLLESTLPDEWHYLKQHLDRFSIRPFPRHRVKNLGSTPFVAVKVRGPTVNIADVGYGVSQILFWYFAVSRSFQGRPMPAYFLLQQPEVHIHPRSRTLSLFAQLASHGNQSFIVETHSDYMIDCAHRRRGNLDVSIYSSQ